MVAFVPILMGIGGVLIRAMTPAVAKRLADIGFKEVAKKIAKQYVFKKQQFKVPMREFRSIKQIDDFVKSPDAKSILSRLKNIKSTTKPTVNTPKKTTTSEKSTGPAKPRVTSSNVKDALNKTKESPKSSSTTKKIEKPKVNVKPTTKPKVTTPKKTTTTQKTTGPAKPTVNKTTTKPKTQPKASPPKPPKQVKKPSNLPRNAVIVAGIGGAGFMLDKLVNRIDRPVKVDKTTDRPKRESTPITPKGPPQRTSTTKKSDTKVEPTFSNSFLNKIAASKPKSNLSRFGKAFKKARKQGRYSFMFDGREITTRFKEETVAEHKKKFGKK